MPLPVYRLRRWLAATAVVFSAVVAGMYFYAHLRLRNVLNEVPGKIGYDLKQTATGFQFSKSDGGRTLFTIQSHDLKQFKLNGRAELHKVTIILYGRDSSRFDEIYGNDFTYDPTSGNVTARGEVQIDIEANPSGLASPDQTTPKALKNPLHLKTSDLIFNKETGNAATDARIEFQTPQARGWAMGAKYDGRTNTLKLESQIHVSLTGANGTLVQATSGAITKEPRQIVLEHAQLERMGGTVRADRATIILGPENNVERVLANGNIEADRDVVAKAGRAQDKAQTKAPPGATAASAERPQHLHARADYADLLLTGTKNDLRMATLTGDVRMERTGWQPFQGSARRVILDFTGKNQLQKVHAAEGVRLLQPAAVAEKPKAGSGPPQNFELTAPIVDFFVSKGNLLKRAVTSGAAQITIFPPADGPGSGPSQSAQRTVVTAGRFDARFKTLGGRSQVAAIHGEPNAKIVSLAPGEPNRVSTSQSVDANFLAQGGIESLRQRGNVFFTDDQPADKRMQAAAEAARYTPADQILLLTGSPRVTDGSMATTAKTIRINRSTGDAMADTDVKSTYSELKDHPDGGLLASSSPIHVTARTMTAHSNQGIALYSGNARLWQDANLIEAPTIQFERERRFVVAQGTPEQPVLTTLVQSDKGAGANPRPGRGKSDKPATESSPIAITGRRLTYADMERKAHYEGGVLARGANFTASAGTLDAYLLPHGQGNGSDNQPLGGASQPGPGRLDRMVAQDHVVVQQPNRRAEGENLTYGAAEDKFVLTGGSPSIFDAERGKTTGNSLTFFRRDDRVLVEGEARTPVVTQTRVAR